MIINDKIVGFFSYLAQKATARSTDKYAVYTKLKSYKESVKDGTAILKKIPKLSKKCLLKYQLKLVFGNSIA